MQDWDANQRRWREEVPLLPPCVTMWIGSKLGALERACLRSVIRAGHQMILYCYDIPAGIPEGVQVADAASVLSRDRIIRYPNGSYALFANLFRYEAQRLGLGTWLDCDAYLLKPLPADTPYLIGEYEPGKFNNGVLRIPVDSPLLQMLLAPFDGTAVPAWLPLRAKLTAWLRFFATGRADVAKMPWGTTGPLALTNAVNASAIDVTPLPPPVLYPVRWQDAAWLTDPAESLKDKITPETVSIHLWNERIKHVKHAPAPPGSFLRRIQEEGA